MAADGVDLVGDAAKEAITGLLAENAEERWTAKGLLESAWIGSSREQLDEMYKLRFERK